MIADKLDVHYAAVSSLERNEEVEVADADFHKIEWHTSLALLLFFTTSQTRISLQSKKN